ncbi:hypothetical protein D7316_01820 [Gordonia insulae]|uniref:Uncharacterized protein n=1 Tax=Gordonia insulae TaxID=2420509 RepID=A0A3G8JKR3_9ACTN|nr:hypothetical protein D7316_01820 [Gordonia insulae]
MTAVSNETAVPIGRLEDLQPGRDARTRSTVVSSPCSG